MAKYLNPIKLQELAKTGGDTLVRVYTNGIYHVAPDPRDEAGVSGCKATYETGGFISFTDVKIPGSMLDDLLQ